MWKERRDFFFTFKLGNKKWISIYISPFKVYNWKHSKCILYINLEHMKWGLSLITHKLLTADFTLIARERDIKTKAYYMVLLSFFFINFWCYI